MAKNRSIKVVSQSGVQLGISIRDLDLLTIGMVNDMYVESGNDQDADKNYSVLATQVDFDRF